MSKRIKKHTTVTLTMAMILPTRPCRKGLSDVRRFLPAKLSTDPLDNLDLADALCAADQGGRALWLLGESSLGTVGTYTYPDSDYWIRTMTVPDEAYKPYRREPNRDPWVIAQALAWIADGIANKEGR